MRRILKFYLKKFAIRKVKKKRLVSKKYLKYKESARELVKSRLEFFNQHYNLEYKRISIKNQKGRWGSCSSKGNLNFNYKIVLLPLHLADYIIVHELCHLKEFNHGEGFWKLVEEKIPNYNQLKEELKRIRV